MRLNSSDLSYHSHKHLPAAILKQVARSRTVFQPFLDNHLWVPVSRPFGKGMTHVDQTDENRTISK